MVSEGFSVIAIQGACEHNLKNLDLSIERGAITLITGVSGSGKSSLAFDTVLAEAQRRFFYTLSHYSRQFLDMGSRPKVRRITGLSPAISLAQNETAPSRRASVATLSDAGELLGVLFARFGTRNCPKHNLPTASLSLDDVVERIVSQYDDQQVAICVPLAENKKGSFKKQLTAFASKGFTRAYVDGKVIGLMPIPSLEREEKHTIKVFIDVVKVKADRVGRLKRSLETASEEGQGFGEFYLAPSPQSLDMEQCGRFGGSGGCPECGFSWPELDSRYFSANSLGRCTPCKGMGSLGADDESESAEEDVVNDLMCTVCLGTGLDPQYNAIRIQGSSIAELHLADLETVQLQIAAWRSSPLGSNPAFERVASEVAAVLRRISDVGLHYLNLARRIRTLSGGEAQRLKLAGILAESLRGVLYVLDEPSQGLHPAELEKMWDVLARLKALGNTLLIVDHDENLIRKADWIIDLGPGGGANGGKLLGKFRPQEAGDFVATSATARSLTTEKRYVVRNAAQTAGNFLRLQKVRLHNLDLNEVAFPLRAMTAVTGVSGAGKSSLVMGVVAPNLSALARANAKRGSSRPAPLHCKAILGGESITLVTSVNRKPIGKSHVSMPATYLDLYKDIRDLFGQLPEAQIAGLTPRDFSVTATGGRCPECKGRGQVSLTMRFLPDARVVCPLCEGRRFRPHVLEVKYGGHSIADVLGLTLEEVALVFKNHKRVLRLLSPALQLGLGYLKLGQPSATLSGGEAQRLKLAPLLARPDNTGHLLILEEPTAGLHAEDVTKLVAILHRLVDTGATVITIEHNADVIRSSDWVIDLGPGAASEGGNVVFAGRPATIGACKASLTAKYLQ